MMVVQSALPNVKLTVERGCVHYSLFYRALPTTATHKLAVTTQLQSNVMTDED